MPRQSQVAETRKEESEGTRPATEVTSLRPSLSPVEDVTKRHHSTHFVTGCQGLPALEPLLASK